MQHAMVSKPINDELVRQQLRQRVNSFQVSVETTKTEDFLRKNNYIDPETDAFLYETAKQEANECADCYYYSNGKCAGTANNCEAVEYVSDKLNHVLSGSFIFDQFVSDFETAEEVQEDANKLLIQLCKEDDSIKRRAKAALAPHTYFQFTR